MSNGKSGLYFDMFIYIWYINMKPRTIGIKAEGPYITFDQDPYNELERVTYRERRGT
jgi:hypothetical protein